MSEVRKKTHIFMVRAEPSEAEEIQLRAREAGISVPEFFRRLALSRKVNPNARMTAESLRELSRIGNNLNQISHAINAGQIATHDDLKDTLYMVRKAASSLVEKGGRS